MNNYKLIKGNCNIKKKYSLQNSLINNTNLLNNIKYNNIAEKQIEQNVSSKIFIFNCSTNTNISSYA